MALARWAVTKVAPEGPLEAASAGIHPRDKPALELARRAAVELQFG